MDAGDQAPQLLQLVPIVKFRRATTPAGINRETEQAGMKKRLPVDRHRRDKRNFLSHEFIGKRMLLENRGIAPAAWAVEFDDNIVIVPDADLVDTVFVAVQG